MHSIIATISCPLLIHRDGFVIWGNQAFSKQFGIRPTAVESLKIRELLWCLGIQDPLAGMIAEGVLFECWEVAPLNPALSVLYLRQMRLFDEDDRREMFALMISDNPELPIVVSPVDEGGSC